MPAAQPVLGYPSKNAAILALHREGKSPWQIAEAIGMGLRQVQVAINHARAKGKLDPAPPGPWSPEKIEKARRVHRACLEEIARALAVPLEELVRVVNGLAPAETRAEIDEAPLPVLKPHPEPSREDDEAELAALAESDDEELEEDEDEPEIAVGGGIARPDPEPEVPLIAGHPVLDEAKRYYLRTAGGKYLHESCTGFVKEKGRNAYCQPPAKIRRLRLRYPDFKDLLEEAAE